MKKINSILIANRGEIASRIIRTCKNMGIRSIAVYSEADQNALFVSQADVAVFIGASSPARSYLNQDAIIEAARTAQADAIHPGYGFLSESIEFAKRCHKEKLTFIGPHPKAIELMGSKSKAKTLMQKHNVPVIPGYQGKDQSVSRLKKAAKEIGFPVLLKATAGGGGKGMRIVEHEKELKGSIEAAKREALLAFGNDELILEKYIESGRHIEFQIFGDQHNNAIHLLERECTIQRRHQKVVEESPSPVMSEKLRKKMGIAAVKASKALKYDNAGTVEFIYNEGSGDFYFLEVNTRLQVEHPVTEEITGLDLVQMQIESAQGTPLSVKQENVNGNGYAVEVRLYAEDPENDFLPVTGTIQKFKVPEVSGLRIETAIKTGSEISIHYDPMIAKIIIWDQERINAHRKLKHVLKNLICIGITTNQEFLLHLCDDPNFEIGKYDTHYIQNHFNPSAISDKNEDDTTKSIIAATLFDWIKRNTDRSLLRSIPSGWRNNFYTPQKESFTINGKELNVSYSFNNEEFEFHVNNNCFNAKIIDVNNENIRVEINKVQFTFHIVKDGYKFYLHNESTGTISLMQKERFPIKETEKQKGIYEAPMPSQVVKVLVKEGQKIKAGDGLVILSSMKMENTIMADEDGLVKDIYSCEGDNIEAGYTLMKIKVN